MSRAERYGAVKKIAIELASGPNGMTNAAFRAATGTESCGSRIAHLCRLGHIYKASAVGKRMRWFDSAARAAAWVAANGGPAAGPSPQAVSAEKRRNSVDAPVTIPKRAQAFDGEADDSRAKRTRCPSPGHDVRYQLPPGTRIVGGFASAGIGRYLEDAR